MSRIAGLVVVNRSEPTVAYSTRGRHLAEACPVFPARVSVGGSRISFSHGKQKAPEPWASLEVHGLRRRCAPVSGDGDGVFCFTSRAPDRQVLGPGVRGHALQFSVADRAGDPVLFCCLYCTRNHSFAQPFPLLISVSSQKNYKKVIISAAVAASLRAAARSGRRGI